MKTKAENQKQLGRLYFGFEGLPSPENPGSVWERHHDIVAISE
jgi:hypothetical protein